MSGFKTTTLSTLPSIIEPLSDSAKFWKNDLQPATVYKELSAINCIDINGVNEILTTSSTRIALYETSDIGVKRTFSTSNHTQLYCGTFRKDNSKIFASGGGDGIVRVWDIKKSKPLRLLGSDESGKSDKHTAAVHRTNFNGVNHLFSCGDDKLIKLWDITQCSVVSAFGEIESHQDYIRASSLLENLSCLVSGSYDHTVKVWDQRTPQSSTFNYNHGSPVESVTCRDFLVISVGQTNIKIFDVVAGKVIRSIDNAHHKTITAVHNHGNYLLTASIDGHLKVFDLNFNVATSLSYVPSHLLSCCYNGSILAVGTSDGILSVNKVLGKNKKVDNLTSISDEASDEFLFGSMPIKKKKTRLNTGNDALVVNAVIKKKFLSKHEELLRKFKHSEALNRVLRHHGKEEPETVVSFMQELIRRGSLKMALAGRPDKKLAKIIFFLTKNLSDPRFTRILVDVSLQLVEIYTSQINRSSDILSLFMRLNNTLTAEINSLAKMSELSGQLQILINSQIK